LISEPSELDLGFGIIIAGHVVVDEIIDRAGQVAPRKALGGAPSYSSLALSSLGYKPEIVTHIGNDFPDEYARLIKERTGLNLYKWAAPGYKTTSYRIDRSGEHRRLWLVSRCKELAIEDFRAYLAYAPSTAIVLNPVANEISLSLLERISKEFEYVFVDSQGFVRRFDKRTGEVGMRSGLDISTLAGVDVLKADQEELEAWSGTSNKDSAIRQLSKFVDTLLVTSGPSLVEVYEHGKLELKASPFKVQVADTTGAGDIMLSSFAARYAETNDLRKALVFAVTASTLAVRKYGIEKAILSKPEVESQSTLVEIRAETN
jgi:sugar/nucleoside kinase (ribokinase family)